MTDQVNPQDDTPRPLTEIGQEQRARGKAEPLPRNLLKKARHLRKEQTPAEALLWDKLKNRQLNGLKFRRQYAIAEGCILDFYCAERKMAVELDGAYHHTENQAAYDADRTAFLATKDIRVIRFSNSQVEQQIEAVLLALLEF